MAFDYLSRLLLLDENADLLAKEDDALSDADKEKLLPLMELIKGISKNSHELIHLKSEQGKETERINFEAQQKVLQLSLDSTENTLETMTGIKDSLKNVVQGATKAYNYVMNMYIAAFILGIGLVVTSIYFAAQDKPILAIAFGAVGFIDLVTTFFFKPPIEIQNSRSNLAQLMIIITNWFAELINMNSYLQQKGETISLEEMKEVSSILNDSTKKMVDLIEKYSEVRDKTVSKKD